MDFMRFFRRRACPSLNAIYIAGAAGKPMQSVEAIEAVAGRGLLGDRYCENIGKWQGSDGCQVTLITENGLRNAIKRAPNALYALLENGGHRRNLVIGGIEEHQLEGRQFRIGDAVFSYQKLRPPCAYLDKVAGDGMSRALGRDSGVCLRIVTGGRIAIGDTLEIID